MKKEVIKQIFDCLKSSGFSVCFPGQYKGECRREYVVIKREGSLKYLGVSTTQDIYTILCYVPEDRYSRLSSLTLDVIESLRKLFPLIRQTGEMSESFYDEKAKAYMISIEYVNYRQIKYRN